MYGFLVLGVGVVSVFGRFGRVIFRVSAVGIYVELRVVVFWG